MHLKDDREDFGELKVDHYWIGDYHFYFEKPLRTLFTENETNTERLYGQPNKTPYVKDAFHTAVKEQRFDWLEEKKQGTKFAPLYEFNVAAQSSATIKLRLSKHHLEEPFGEFGSVFENRIDEANEFYADITANDKELFNVQSRLCRYVVEQTILY
jgi:hypothetical protein